MSKIGIITHYDVHNHGAILQLNALIKTLKGFGLEAKALRFDKNYDFLGHKQKAKYEVSAKSIGIYLRFLKEKGISCTYYNYRKRKLLNRYKLNENIIGTYYSESTQLDTIIIGSDEVFALHTGPTPVFFGYCLPSDNIVSYAGSFGPTTTEDIDKLHSRNFVKSGLSGMKMITVRDENSANIVEKLVRYRPPIVVDPVLLYGYKDEIDELNSPMSEDYLLVYSYDNRMNSSEEIESIRKYARKNNLKIISAGFYHKWCDKCINVDPIQLLSWFKFAKYVITDTFHGSVMSIITEANFAVKTRPSNHFKLTNLLKEYNLSDRIFSDWDKFEETITKELDYTAVREEVKTRREFSKELLKKMIM